MKAGKPSGVLHAGKHVVCVAFTFTQSLRRHKTRWLSNDVVDAECACRSAVRDGGSSVIERSGELESFGIFSVFWSSCNWAFIFHRYVGAVQIYQAYFRLQQFNEFHHQILRRIAWEPNSMFEIYMYDHHECNVELLHLAGQA